MVSNPIWPADGDAKEEVEERGSAAPETSVEAAEGAGAQLAGDGRQWEYYVREEDDLGGVMDDFTAA